jgi:hypothetical protein
LQLDATTSTGGTFAYLPSAGTVLGAGAQTLSVTFTPTDATDYTTASASVPLTVNKVTPTITWATPAPISYGTALSGLQLDATASTGGTFAYLPSAGTVLSAGAQTLSVTFTPADATDYTTATATVPLVVAKLNAGMSVVSTVNPSIYGETITVTVTMTGAGVAPSGSVVVTDGVTNLGTQSLTIAGAVSTATLTTSTLSAGTHNFSVAYSGDSNYK